MTRVLLVGGNSFLARATRSAVLPGVTWATCGHDDFAGRDLSAFDRIVNFALHPDYRAGREGAPDVDLAVGRAAKAAGRPFVMLSSRKVYGSQAPFPANENAPLNPDDGYGHNKARTEMQLRAELGESLTVLRVANTFGFEPGRPTFFGIALQSLARDGRIVLDTAATVRRDFLPVENFAQALARGLAENLAGTFNLGSGVALPVGEIAAHLFQGFGRGELVVTSNREHDSFLLDSGRLTDRIGPYCTQAGILSRCIELGKELHAQQA